MAGWSRLRGAWLVSLLVLVAAVLALSGETAVAKHVRRTSRALPGTNFDGGDGNQANGTGFDWEGLQAQGKVHHKADCPTGVASPCPIPGDDIYAGGNKATPPGAGKSSLSRAAAIRTQRRPTSSTRTGDFNM